MLHHDCRFSVLGSGQLIRVLGVVNGASLWAPPGVMSWQGWAVRRLLTDTVSLTSSMFRADLTRVKRTTTWRPGNLYDGSSMSVLVRLGTQRMDEWIATSLGLY
ncbi:hypothetical protein RRG08_034509 [Elysia crispata]|uniref:Uncharacterized protein n=1 Tax=Elysia crispata TaxID=231223 RepID=A0AAE1EDW3_9GAST|nr:hypothetical protein RRG08_034509 [Elysia crispata]